MGDYKRYISYLYRYINGTKDNNVGFVKLESKQGEVKLSINLKCKETIGLSMKLCMFYREDSTNLSEVKNFIDKGISLIEIDEYIQEGYDYSNTYRTSATNVFDSGKNIDNISGVIILINGGEVLAAEWDNSGIDVMDINKDKVNKEIDEGIISNIGMESIYKNIENDTMDKEDYSTDKEEMIWSDIKEEIIENVSIQKEKMDSEQININNQEDEFFNFNRFNESRIINKAMQEREIKEQKRNSFISRRFKNFPGMYPFEDDEILECVKFEPHDIGLFSMDKWPLANNSFLLHGFYTYRHLIFAQMQSRSKQKYILGVPGIFRDREKFMAHMFGFKGFKGVRNKPLENGEFGYWYLEIKL